MTVADLPDLPDLTGRTAVVTGASSGLGLVTATGLARAGAHVVLAVRDPGKGRDAARDMPGRTEVRELDLASLEPVRAFAAGWTGDLDVLVNNAGIMQVPQGRTEDGFELQMGTNHLGPFSPGPSPTGPARWPPEGRPSSTCPPEQHLAHDEDLAAAARARR